MFFLLLFLNLLYAEADAPLIVTPSYEKIEVDIFQKRFAEALAALKSVPSGGKGKKHDQLLEKAAVGYLKSESNNVNNAENLAEELPKTFPLLKESKSFQRERDTISQAGFERCFKESEDDTECALRLFAKVDKDTSRTDFLIWAADKLYQEQQSDLSFKALQLGGTSKRKKQVCQDKRVVTLLVNHLSQNSLNEKALSFIKENCWLDIRYALAKQIARQKNSSFLKNACLIFQEKKTSHEECKKLDRPKK